MRIGGLIKPIVVGIGGASCSGKSTAAEALHKLFQCRSRVVCQDIYATNPLNEASFERNHEGLASRVDTWLNWESLDTINIDSFVSAVNDAVTTAEEVGDKIVVVEGFLIFAGVSLC